MNIYDIVYRFGQIPVGVRSYVGGMIAIQADGASAGTAAGFVAFAGDCKESVWLHEA